MRHRVTANFMPSFHHLLHVLPAEQRREDRELQVPGERGELVARLLADQRGADEETPGGPEFPEHSCGAHVVAKTIIEAERDIRTIDLPGLHATDRFAVTDERVLAAELLQQLPERWFLIAEHVMQVDELHARA